MTQTQREIIKNDWFKGSTNIKETHMPSNARFFVGQKVVHNHQDYEVVGFYDYDGDKYPHYLCLILSGKNRFKPIGIPLTVQGEMYLKSEEHLHRTAKIINMFDYFKK